MFKIIGAIWITMFTAYSFADKHNLPISLGILAFIAVPMAIGYLMALEDKE